MSNTEKTTKQAVEPSLRAQARAVPRSWIARAGYALFGQIGARIGLAWVLAMVMMAVFAPFIANSHPYVWTVEGKTEYPLFANLNWRDLALLVGFFAAVALYFVKRVPASTRVGGWLVVLTLSTAGRLAVPLYGYFSASLENGASIGTRVVMGLLLLLIGVGVMAFALRKLLGKQGAATFTAVILLLGLVLGGAFAALPQPPNIDTVSYEVYREAIASAQAQADNTTGGGERATQDKVHGVFAPIAYSASDFQIDDTANRALQAPSLTHLMGTGANGADVASRMLHATRVALVIGLIATGIALVLGVIIGGLMGYFSGWVDLIGMRLVEIFSAIPVIFILIMICAVYDRNIYLMMTVIGLTGWVGYAVFIRAEFLRLRKMDYVQAAQAIGTPLHGILFRHLLPNGVAPVLVLASFGFASAILFESSLSFLGLGLPERDPSWGQLLQEARTNGGKQWWLVFYPGLAIFLTVFAYNLIGEALRDVIDPRAVK